MLLLFFAGCLLFAAPATAQHANPAPPSIALPPYEVATIGYHFRKDAIPIYAMLRCQDDFTTSCKDEGAPIRHIVAPTYEWRFVDTRFGQVKQGLVISGADADHLPQIGYYTLDAGTAIDIPETPNDSFTVQATVWLPTDHGTKSILWTITNDRGDDVAWLEWSSGALHFVRRSPLPNGQLVSVIDTPWDFNEDWLKNGVPWSPWKAGQPDARIVEVYARFDLASGKVNLDVVRWPIYQEDGNKVSPDAYPQWVGHLQDLGIPVLSYPPQRDPPNWKPPTYPKLSSVKVGRIEQFTVSNTLQLAVFAGYLSDDAIARFSTGSAFWSGIRNPKYLVQGNMGSKPCNSGEWMLTPSNQTIETACGERQGALRANAKRLRQDVEEAEVD